MADVQVLDEKTIRIQADVADAITMIREAERQTAKYARDIITIYEKMPEFNYTYFCFYAYDSAALFEHMLGIDPKAYTSFSMDAPDTFFYTLYGGMAALAGEAAKALESVTAD